MPAVAGVTANASPNVRRRSRIGFGAGTIAPFGSATTAVIPASAGRFACANVASRPFALTSSQPARLPCGPLKHATRSMVAGACTVAAAASIGTDHSWPITSQFSSS